MTKDKAILVLDSLSTWLGHERPITEEIVEAIKTLSKPSISSDPEEAAEEQARTFGYQKEDYEYKELVETFIAGAKWDREQMLSEAVEGEVDFINKIWQLYEDKGQMDALLRRMGAKRDEKVRIIIVKEDSHEDK